MFEFIRNQRGEAVMGTFLILLFLLFVGGKVAEDHKTVPAVANTVQGEKTP
jgi:hypothetical protein